MNFDEYKDVFNWTVSECYDLGLLKGAEYRGDEGGNNVHANFDRLASKLGVEPITILMVYLTKHLDSIDTYARLNQREHSGMETPSYEPITGRINDAINYLILLKAMILRDNYGRLPKDVRPTSEQISEIMKPGPGTWIKKK